MVDLGLLLAAGVVEVERVALSIPYLYPMTPFDVDEVSAISIRLEAPQLPVVLP